MSCGDCLCVLYSRFHALRCALMSVHTLILHDHASIYFHHCCGCPVFGEALEIFGGAATAVRDSKMAGSTIELLVLSIGD